MERQQMIEKMRDILSDEFEVEKELILEDAPLMSTLELDRLDVVDMVVLIEKHFGLKMSKQDFSEIRTFGNLYDFIGSKL